jgi:TPR repeat protein
LPKTGEEVVKRIMDRVKANDPAALRERGNRCRQEGDIKGAFEYDTKAAELGDAVAHYNLSVTYREGQGVEKDKEKYIYHLEEAAIGGHPGARHVLGALKLNNDMFERSKKHFIIAANLGHHDSLKELMKLYSHGLASKEDYADALRAYQAAVDETKSKEREKAEKAMKNGEMICA